MYVNNVYDCMINAPPYSSISHCTKFWSQGNRNILEDASAGISPRSSTSNSSTRKSIKLLRWINICSCWESSAKMSFPSARGKMILQSLLTQGLALIDVLKASTREIKLSNTEDGIAHMLERYLWDQNKLKSQIASLTLDAVWLFWVTGIIPGEERFAGYYPANEDLFPGEGGFTGNFQPNEVGNTGEQVLTGISRP